MDHRTLNLNEARNTEVRVKEGQQDALTEDASFYADDAAVIFRNVKRALVHQIKRADWVYGCVAWLTDYDVLSALAQKKGVFILVQKEDFLRPDGTSRGKNQLQKMYAALKVINREWFRGVLRWANYADMEMDSADGVRCVGYKRAGNERYGPLMHHKFALFGKGDLVPAEEETLTSFEKHWMTPRPPPPPRPPSTTPETGIFRGIEDAQIDWSGPYHRDYKPRRLPVPYCVWTGSYNWSENASRSAENAVVLTDQRIISAYDKEFQQLALLSEPLDWASEFTDPMWRVGCGT